MGRKSSIYASVHGSVLDRNRRLAIQSGTTQTPTMGKHTLQLREILERLAMMVQTEDHDYYYSAPWVSPEIKLSLFRQC